MSSITDRIRSAIRELINSGTDYRESNIQKYGLLKNIQFINITCLLFSLLIIVLAVLTHLSGHTADLYYLYPSLGLLIMIMALLRINHDSVLPPFLLVLFIIYFMVISFIYGSRQHTGLLFNLAFPVIVFYLFNKRTALIWTVMYITIISLLPVLNRLGTASTMYSGPFYAVMLANALLISIFSFLFKQKEENLFNFIRKETYLNKLTGLPNRNQFLTDLRNFPSPALFLININDFREINDTLGYDAGDAVLKFVADKISSVSIEEPHKIYNLSGDEFALMVEIGESDIPWDRLVSIVNTIRHYINLSKFTTRGFDIVIRVSIGISVARVVGKHNLFSRADIALKSAKRNLRPYFFFRQEESIRTREQFENNIRTANILSDAIDNNNIVTMYQPIYDNRSGEINKYECLVRILDRESNLVPPVTFLELAKKLQLYVYLTRSVLSTAIDTFKGNDHTFSVNLSLQDITDVLSRNFIYKKLESFPEVTGQICFEILESEGIENYGIVSEFISRVKEMGCKIAIDDFGTGYSNFDHLLKLNIDYLKIDGSLIRNINTDSNSETIVRTIINFARKMKIQTIAEYVHSLEILEMMKEMGIDYSQGYYISPPERKLIRKIQSE